MQPLDELPQFPVWFVVTDDSVATPTLGLWNYRYYRDGSRDLQELTFHSDPDPEVGFPRVTVSTWRPGSSDPRKNPDLYDVPAIEQIVRHAVMFVDYEELSPPIADYDAQRAEQEELVRKFHSHQTPWDTITVTLDGAETEVASLTWGAKYLLVGQDAAGSGVIIKGVSPIPEQVKIATLQVEELRSRLHPQP